MSRSIETSTVIAAPRSHVWAILMDFASYPEWNPFIRSINGSARLGEILQVVIQPPGRQVSTFRPRVIELEPNQSFQWRGSLPIPGLFVGEHRFELGAADGGVRFTQSEDFSGLLVPFVAGVLEATAHGFRNMNDALKARAEGR